MLSLGRGAAPAFGGARADQVQERRRDEEGTISLGRGSACAPLDRFLRRWAGNDLGLKGGKPRRLDAGSYRNQLGKKQMLSGRVVTALARDRFAGEE